MNALADILIIGAGVAGLSAARRLSGAGLHVLVLEARNRIGGRLLTHIHPAAGYPVELGAEFIHGSPAEILDLVKEAGLPVTGTDWNGLRRRDGRWYGADEMLSGIFSLFEKMSGDDPDQSFQEFLNKSELKTDPELMEQALGFVEGFHAADPQRISVHSLIRNTAAEEEDDQGSQFRFTRGYETFVKSIADRIDGRFCRIQLNTVITEVKWEPGESMVKTASGHEFHAARTLITVPLGVLKSGDIRFHPRLEQKEKALQGLEMGPAVRASLCFKTKFWETQPQFKSLRFMLTDDPCFPAWWASSPLPYPVLTGWAAGRYGRALENLKAETVIDRALESLANIFEMDRTGLAGALEAGYTHDWQADPFARGAYSYALAGGSDAGRDLGTPVADTLFFAGEATDSNGRNATVHGAIASGLRAAEEVLKSHH